MMLVAKEWEKSALDLDADVRHYVPYWPDKHWDGEKVPFELWYETDQIPHTPPKTVLYLIVVGGWTAK